MQVTDLLEQDFAIGLQSLVKLLLVAATPVNATADRITKVAATVTRSSKFEEVFLSGLTDGLHA